MTRIQLLKDIKAFQTPLQEKNEERLHAPHIDPKSICIALAFLLFLIRIGIKIIFKV